AEAKENLLERIQAESRAIDGERHHYGCLVLGGALCGCACRVRRSSRRIEGTACAARAACARCLRERLSREMADAARMRALRSASPVCTSRGRMPADERGVRRRVQL